MVICVYWTINVLRTLAKFDNGTQIAMRSEFRILWWEWGGGRLFWSQKKPIGNRPIPECGLRVWDWWWRNNAKLKIVKSSRMISFVCSYSIFIFVCICVRLRPLLSAVLTRSADQKNFAITHPNCRFMLSAARISVIYLKKKKRFFKQSTRTIRSPDPVQ